MLKWFKRDKQRDRDAQPDPAGAGVEASDLEESELDFIFEVDEPEPEPAGPPAGDSFDLQEEAVVETDRPESIEPAPEDLEILLEAADVEGAEDSEIEVEESVQAPEDLEIMLGEVEGGPEEEAVDELKLEDEQEPPADVESRPGFLARLKARLAETRAILTTRVDHLLLGIKEIDEDVIEDLEEILITSDLGVKTTQSLIKVISDQVARKELGSAERLKAVLRQEMIRMLSLPPARIESGAHPHVIMVVGVNGVGKTTTIAKLAHRYIHEGQKVMMVAGDTFRAAAVEQLTIWSERVGADIVKQRTGADPSAVVFDALHAARARGADVVIIDTAGRLHTNVNLLEELKKIKRIAGREMPGAPQEVLLVLDATTGQNAVNQARMFNQAVEISHIAMTKLDGTAKGGILIGICHELGLPIRYIGIGEQMDDLRDFDAEAFVQALFES